MDQVGAGGDGGISVVCDAVEGVFSTEIVEHRNLAIRLVDAHGDAELSGFFQHGIHAALFNLSHLSHDPLTLFGIAHVGRLKKQHNRVCRRRWPT